MSVKERSRSSIPLRCCGLSHRPRLPTHFSNPIQSLGLTSRDNPPCRWSGSRLCTIGTSFEITLTHTFDTSDREACIGFTNFLAHLSYCVLGDCPVRLTSNRKHRSRDQLRLTGCSVRRHSRRNNHLNMYSQRLIQQVPFALSSSLGHLFTSPREHGRPSAWNVEYTSYKGMHEHDINTVFSSYC